jgi:hypothetical protein
MDGRAHPSGEFVVPVVLFGAGDLGEFGKIHRYGRIEFVLQERDEELADAVAGEMVIGVGGVFTPALVEIFEVLLEFTSAKNEERAKDFSAELAVVVFDGDEWVNAGESFEAGAADQSHENGFGLVVEGVSGEDCVDCVGFAEQVVKEAVAEFAGGGFDADVLFSSALPDVVAVAVKFQIVFAGEAGDELLVGVGFGAAELVVEVDYREDDAEFEAKLEHQAKKGDGVDASGDGDAQAVAGVEEVMATNVGEDALRQCVHETWYIVDLVARCSRKRG